jgi:4-hydroxythreonine-4-phosphate dehydrogenase
MTLPRIGLTAGDPAGIGLEVTLRALEEMAGRASWTLFASRPDFEQNLEQHSHRFGGGLGWTEDPLGAEPGLVRVVFVHDAGEAIRWGEGSPESGRRAVASLEAATRAAAAGELAAIVTAPLNKAMAGPGFLGQTEFLSEHSGGAPTAMSFFTPTFKVVLVTTHMALRAALDALSTPRYTALLELVAAEMARFGWPRPRIALAAVNPHAGEGGRFGDEDERILAPAAAKARDRGIDVTGPLSADSLYARAHSGEFDVVVAPYHDQGLAPVKIIAPRSAANVTLGLPFVRTSPDHGTAYEIAGKGRADAGGMKTAMEWAIELVGRQESFLRQVRQSP